MDAKQIEMIKGILHNLADQLQPGDDSEKTLRSALTSLLLSEEKSRRPLASLKPEEQEELRKYNKRLIDVADRFLAQYLLLPLTPEQQKTEQQLRERLDRSQAELDAERQLLLELQAKLTELRAQMGQISADCKVQAASNERLLAQCSALREEFQKIKAENDALQAELAQYSDAARKEREAENTELAGKVADKKSEFEALDDQKESLLRQLEEANARLNKQKGENTQIQSEIDAEPEELKRLEAEHTALSERLKRIRNAAEECSEERLAALKAEIDELRPKVDALKAQYAEVTKAHETLTAAYQTRLEETSAAEDALLKSMEEAIDVLQAHCESLAAKLRAAESRASQFEESRQYVRENYDRYSSWLQSDVPALQALCSRAGLSSREYAQLYETLDLQGLESLRTLQTEIEARLQQLDAFISDGSAAAQRDQENNRSIAEYGVTPQQRG